MCQWTETDHNASCLVEQPWALMGVGGNGQTKREGDVQEPPRCFNPAGSASSQGYLGCSCVHHAVLHSAHTHQPELLKESLPIRPMGSVLLGTHCCQNTQDHGGTWSVFVEVIQYLRSWSWSGD